MALYNASIFVRRRVFLLVALVGFLVSSCGPQVSRTAVGVENSTSESAKITVEAYLFDAVFYHEGKTTSFRLELYATDTIVALSGRGYLGKGVLRGVMHSRSIQVYFPTSNEFIDESYASLFSRGECRMELSSFDPVRLMFASPDSMAIDSQIHVVEIKRSEKRREFLVSSLCKWKLLMVYDSLPCGWRPVEITFDDGQGKILMASRREYQPRAKVKPTRFTFPFPPDAHRLKP